MMAFSFGLEFTSNNAHVFEKLFYELLQQKKVDSTKNYGSLLKCFERYLPHPRKYRASGDGKKN